jgi:multiple sugar transport system substrate-binding protein
MRKAADRRHTEDDEMMQAPTSRQRICNRTAGVAPSGLQPRSRRDVLAGLAAGGVAALALACQARPGTGPATGPSQPAKAQVSGQLTFWSFPDNDPSNAAWEQRLADFQQAHPQATVERVQYGYGDIHSKLPVVVAGGTPPDVSIYDRFLIPTAAFRELVQDVLPKAKTAGIQADLYQPWTWQEVFLDGKLYGLPYTTDSRMVYVNVAHLDQAGLPQTPPKTLEEFMQLADRLNARQGDVYQRVGFIPWRDNWGLYGWGWLFGGDFYDPKANQVTLDSPKLVAALQWVGEQAARLGYTQVEEYARQASTAGDLFLTQAVSTYLQANGWLPRLLRGEPEMNWTLWPPPPPQGVGRTHTWSGGFAVVLPPGVKNADAAFELMRFLSDAEFQRVQMQTGLWLPVLKELQQDRFWNTVDPRVKQFVDVLEFSHSRPPIPQIGLLTSQLNAARDAVAKGEKTARAALQEANQRVNQAIAEKRVE